MARPPARKLRRRQCFEFSVLVLVSAFPAKHGTLRWGPSPAVALSPAKRAGPPVTEVGGLPIHRAHHSINKKKNKTNNNNENENDDDAPPYCFALSSIAGLPPATNFLATQVWPSARVAAATLEDRVFGSSGLLVSATGEGPPTVCELGCGPGLPSLVVAAGAAASGEGGCAVRVIATDVDPFALDLVAAAAGEQGLLADGSGGGGVLSTRVLDLVRTGERLAEEDSGSGNANTIDDDIDNDDSLSWLRDVDLFVLSDVFESGAVAAGAARLTHRVLSWGASETKPRRPRRVWVFAQTDRAQREAYREELGALLGFEAVPEWSSPESFGVSDLLWLCDVDETLVAYG